MIGFTLSEKEFDYELQALATGFFPGKRTNVRSIWSAIRGNPVAIKKHGKTQKGSPCRVLY